MEKERKRKERKKRGTGKKRNKERRGGGNRLMSLNSFHSLHSSLFPTHRMCVCVPGHPTANTSPASGASAYFSDLFLGVSFFWIMSLSLSYSFCSFTLHTRAFFVVLVLLNVYTYPLTHLSAYPFAALMGR